MDAIIMPSINWLLNRLKNDYPELTFTPADEFLWSAVKKTVYFNPEATNSIAYTLHELSHALLDHRGYERDIELIKLERDAWDYTSRSLASAYKVTIDSDLIQDNLDTYREWLHSRSSCPECNATGLQRKYRRYQCITCGNTWRVNEARVCALRRYSLQTK